MSIFQQLQSSQLESEAFFDGDGYNCSADYVRTILDFGHLVSTGQLLSMTLLDQLFAAIHHPNFPMHGASYQTQCESLSEDNDFFDSIEIPRGEIAVSKFIKDLNARILSNSCEVRSQLPRGHLHQAKRSEKQTNYISRRWTVCDLPQNTLGRSDNEDEPGKSDDDWPLHPCVKAALVAHFIHRTTPFETGNGRMARVLANFMLQTDGLPFPVALCSSPTEQDSYTTAFSSPSPVLAVKHVMDCVLSTWRRYSFMASSAGLQMAVPLAAQSQSSDLKDPAMIWDVTSSDSNSSKCEERKAAVLKEARAALRTESCLICFESGCDMSALCCGKAYHFHCLAHWMASSQTRDSRGSYSAQCPQCRTTIDLKSSGIFTAAPSNKESEDSVEDSDEEDQIASENEEFEEEHEEEEDEEEEDDEEDADDNEDDGNESEYEEWTDSGNGNLFQYMPPFNSRLPYGLGGDAQRMSQCGFCNRLCRRTCFNRSCEQCCVLVDFHSVCSVVHDT